MPLLPALASKSSFSFSQRRIFAHSKRIALNVCCSNGRAASEKNENVLPPATIASISVHRMNLSVARRLFDGSNFAEFPFLADFGPLLPVFLASKSSGFPRGLLKSVEKDDYLESVWAVFERNSCRQESRRFFTLSSRCFYLSLLPNCHMPVASPMVVILQSFHFGQRQARLPSPMLASKSSGLLRGFFESI